MQTRRLVCVQGNIGNTITSELIDNGVEKDELPGVRPEH